MAPKTAGLWGVARWPALNKGEAPMAGNWGGSFMAILAKSKHKRESWMFIKFFCSQKESQFTLNKMSDSIPAYLPAWQDPYFDEKLAFFAGQQSRLLWLEIARDIPSVDSSKDDALIMAIIGSQLGSVLNENEDIEKAIRDIKSQLYPSKIRRG